MLNYSHFRIIFKSLQSSRATIGRKTFLKRFRNSSEVGKDQKTLIFVFVKVLTTIAKHWFLGERLDFVSIQFWHFLIVSINPQILIFKLFSNSWGNSYTKFIVIDIKFRFACSESNLHEDNVNCQNILSPIVGKLSFAFYHFNKDSNFRK